MKFLRKIAKLAKRGNMKEATFRPHADDPDPEGGVVTVSDDVPIGGELDLVGFHHDDRGSDTGAEVFVHYVVNTAGCSADIEDTQSDRSTFDTSDVDENASRQHKRLSKLFVKYRKTNSLVDSYKKEVDFLTQEIDAVSAMLKRLTIEEKALDSIRIKQLRQLDNLLNVESDVIHSNLKKKESLFYRKYNKATSTEELRNLMASIRQRQTALKHLELLTYRKIINIRTSPKKKARLPPKPAKFVQIVDSTDDVTEFQVNQKPELPGFLPLPWTWENARRDTSSEWKWEPPKPIFFQSQM